jgi:hypothetical protein
MVRYSFLVRFSHAGLSRRILNHPGRSGQDIRRNRPVNLPGGFDIDKPEFRLFFYK